jgi:hypothetical protein
VPRKLDGRAEAYLRMLENCDERVNPDRPFPFGYHVGIRKFNRDYYTELDLLETRNNQSRYEELTLKEMGRENEVSGIVRRKSHDPRYLADSPFPIFNLPEGRREGADPQGKAAYLRNSDTLVQFQDIGKPIPPVLVPLDGTLSNTTSILPQREPG